ncbi:MAG TPA: trypsin-like peptidase domain-containing protein [Aggregatilineales bacterium]|nr:trypsin-like peptidase domain-containing protein [Aggregatilineales bacterium]
MQNFLGRLGLKAGLAFTVCLAVLLGAVLPLMPSVANAQSSGDDTGTLEKIYQQVNPSVVNIQVTIPSTSNLQGLQPFNPNPFGAPTPPAGGQFELAEGSGFVYDTKGDLVTNAHVVQDATKITVSFADDNSMNAKVVGVDLDSDIAVIKIDAGNEKLSPLTLGDSDKLVVGQRAIAIGNPFGYTGTMTQGIISGLGRSLEGQRSAGQGSSYLIPQVIQTDASINPGNSGGVLLDINGNVIGVTTAIESQVRQSSGVSFAVPSNIVKKVADTLIKSGKMDHAYLGIAGTTLDLDLDQLDGLQPNTHGVLVRDVTPDGPAAAAGLKPSTTTKQLDGQPIKVGGDIIVGIDGQPVNRFEDLLAYLFVKAEPGQKIALKVLRDGQSIDVTVTLTARPATTS